MNNDQTIQFAFHEEAIISHILTSTSGIENAVNAMLELNGKYYHLDELALGLMNAIVGLTQNLEATVETIKHIMEPEKMAECLIADAQDRQRRASSGEKPERNRI